MADNLAIWSALERTDPKHVKEITGKAYKGNSPRPHWVIWKLTERFGPVGQGFGWDVLNEQYVDGIPHQDGTEKVHEVRIRFWWNPTRAEDGMDRPHGVESYGATKALYKAGVKNGSPGYWVSDEDAAKKSLTDAITKAASWLGVAADIFMGRWDDSKYVAELKQEAARPANAPQRPAEAPHDRNTGEVIQSRNNPAQAATDGLKDAFRDSIGDSLPFDCSDLSKLHPSERLRYWSVAADILITAFNAKKSAQGTSAQWSKRDDIIMEMQEAAPVHYQRVLEAFNDKMASFREEPLPHEMMRG